MDFTGELESIVREVERARRRLGDAPDRSLPAPLKRRLEDHYWRRITVLVRRTVLDAGTPRLVFERDERLLLDAGFVDGRLLADDPRLLVSRLLVELYEDAGQDGPVYLSGWLDERFREVLMEEALVEPPSPEERRTRLEAEVERLRGTRRKVLAEMEPLLHGLPGIPEPMAALLASGRLHEHLEDLDSALTRESSREVKEKRDRFRGFYRRVLESVRARAGDHRQVLLVTALRKLDAQINEELARLRQEEKRDETRVIALRTDRPSLRNKRSAAMEDELRNLRSLLLLGTLESGAGSSCPVLLADVPRIERAQVGRVLARIEEYDRGAAVIPRILMAPFGGLGFFEWDRNTLILPLYPSVAPEESVVRAFANYRLLVDTLHRGGALRNLLGPVVGEPFRDRFVEEYVAWVLRTGRGEEGAQEPRLVEAFSRHLGPHPQGPIGPARLLAMPDEELELELRELEAGPPEPGSPDDAGGSWEPRSEFQRLRDTGTVLWCLGRPAEALERLQRAQDVAPQDVRCQYAVARLTERCGDLERARSLYEELRAMRPDTLWSVYAGRKLAAWG